MKRTRQAGAAGSGIEYLRTPLGLLELAAGEQGLIRIAVAGSSGCEAPNAITRQATAELREYFAGKRTDFDVPLALRGTDFQRAVWEELSKIPYGCTMTYGELASRLGKPGAARAVGNAAGQNPVLLLIPCHRLVAADGLGGFSAGLERKRLLLQHEGIKAAGINDQSSGNTENVQK